MRSLRLAVVFFLLSSVSQAQELGAALDMALSHWRAAVWYSSTGNTGVAALEIDEFGTQWKALADQTRGNPPAPYQADTQWNRLLDNVATQAESASEALARDDATNGTRHLQEIGNAFATLRARNNIVAFSDHVARFGEIVETLRGMAERRGPLDDATRVLIRATTVQAAVAVVQLSASAPKNYYDDPEFQRLLTQNRDGITALNTALARQDPIADAYEAAGLISVVHANYNILFLRFG